MFEINCREMKYTTSRAKCFKTVDFHIQVGHHWSSLLNYREKWCLEFKCADSGIWDR